MHVDCFGRTVLHIPWLEGVYSVISWKTLHIWSDLDLDKLISTDLTKKVVLSNQTGFIYLDG